MQQVRILEFTAKVGDKIPLHSHPNTVVYIVESGKGGLHPSTALLWRILRSRPSDYSTRFDDALRRDIRGSRAILVGIEK